WSYPFIWIFYGLTWLLTALYFLIRGSLVNICWPSFVISSFVNNVNSEQQNWNNDILSLLKSANAVVVDLGSGWFCGNDGFNDNSYIIGDIIGGFLVLILFIAAGFLLHRRTTVKSW